MAELMILTDATLDTVLHGDKTALILISNGEGVRGEFSTAFKKAAGENPKIVFALLDPSSNPQAEARFEAGSKPVLIGWAGGAEILRRHKPWGTDVPLAIEMLQAAPKQTQPHIQESVSSGEKSVTDQQVVIDNGKPFVVTDATFEQEVLNYDKPVLVDFWAEWCGPCRMVGPILEKLAAEYAGQIRIAKVDVDANPGLSQAFKVMSIPTIMLIKQRTIVFSQPGALPEPAFRELIEKLIALELPPPTVDAEADEKEPVATEQN
jgi:thioredoxin 1